MTEHTSSAGTAERSTSGPVLATVRGLTRPQLRLAGWGTVILAVAVAIVILLIDRFGAVEYSVVGFARQAVIWFPFSLAVAMSSSYLPAHVAMGLTRRTLVRATVLAGVAMSVVYAVIMVVLIQLERIWYHALGWSHGMSQGLTVWDGTSQVDVLLMDSSHAGYLLIEYLLLALSGQVCGLLVGVVYYRTGGWWWGTVTLPLTVGPILLVQAGVDANLWGIVDGGAFAAWSGTGLALRTLVLGAVLLAAAVAYGLVLRATPIRSATT